MASNMLKEAKDLQAEGQLAGLCVVRKLRYSIDGAEYQRAGGIAPLYSVRSLLRAKEKERHRARANMCPGDRLIADGEAFTAEATFPQHRKDLLCAV